MMTTSDTYLIDLQVAAEKYFDHPTSRILVGYKNGQIAREFYTLDLFDLIRDKIIIVHVPEYMFSMSMSFFRGMFSTSILNLGVERFVRKYEFSGRDCSRTIEAGIKDAIMFDSNIPEFDWDDEIRNSPPFTPRQQFPTVGKINNFVKAVTKARDDLNVALKEFRAK